MTTVEELKFFKECEIEHHKAWFDYHARNILMNVGADGDTTPVVVDTSSLTSKEANAKDVETIKSEIESLSKYSSSDLMQLETNIKEIVFNVVVALSEKDYSEFSKLFPKQIMYIMTFTGHVYFHESNTISKNDPSQKSMDKRAAELRFLAFALYRLRPPELFAVIATTWSANIALGTIGKSTRRFDTPHEYVTVIKALITKGRVYTSISDLVDTKSMFMAETVMPKASVFIPLLPAKNFDAFLESNMRNYTMNAVNENLAKAFYVDGGAFSKYVLTPLRWFAQGGRKTVQGAHMIHHKDSGRTDV